MNKENSMTTPNEITLPTNNMIAAGVKASLRGNPSTPMYVLEIWNAMCAAAPVAAQAQTAAKVRDRGFVVVDGTHIPTVIVEFPANDWDARDRFAAAVESSAQQPVSGADWLPAAWMHEDDSARVIPASTKSGAEKDGGAILSSLRPYSIPLFALPQPSGNAGELDERAAFEWWASDEGESPIAIERDGNGNYKLAAIQSHWDAWQARAKLAAQASGQDREDAVYTAVHAAVANILDAETAERLMSAIDAARAAAKGDV